MAKINLQRRAEIGQEKRARTRAQLVAAACALFAKRSWASVTIDELVQEAGVAKGTFYVHFDDMHALTAAVGGRSSSGPSTTSSSLSAPPPPTRSCASPWAATPSPGRRSTDRRWASLVARMARSYPAIGETARMRLREDLQLVLAQSPRPGFSLDLALEVVLGVVLQVMAAIGEGRLSHDDREPAIGAVLGAIGVSRQQAASTLARLRRAKTM